MDVAVVSSNKVYFNSYTYVPVPGQVTYLHAVSTAMFSIWLMEQVAMCVRCSVFVFCRLPNPPIDADNPIVKASTKPKIRRKLPQPKQSEMLPQNPNL